MTPEEHIDSVLQHLAGGRVFPDVAPEKTATPYITYQAVGGAPVNFLSGGQPDKQSVRMQVNCWAGAGSGARIEASELGAQVELAMRAAIELQVEVATGRVATFDETTGYRGTMQDFQIFV